MLIIVLEAAGIPAAGLALIVAPDRILDMCRTVVNVTGDATVATVVDHQLNYGKNRSPGGNVAVQ
jgi:Na+/H+-dicarboxylate symporter